jgi:tetratricopeptide (TPR) repeat protein
MRPWWCWLRWARRRGWRSRLQEDKSLGGKVRQIARGLAAPGLANAHLLARSAWQAVSASRPEPERLREAVRWAEVADKLTPENAFCLGVLGAAQYRAGRYPEALASLMQAARLGAKGPAGLDPATLAFLAMAQQQAGDNPQARATLRRLAAMPNYDALNRDLPALRREAEALVEGKPLPAGN